MRARRRNSKPSFSRLCDQKQCYNLLGVNESTIKERKGKEIKEEIIIIYFDNYLNGSLHDRQYVLVSGHVDMLKQQSIEKLIYIYIYIDVGKSPFCTKT